jgi:hypothetical protein
MCLPIIKDNPVPGVIVNTKIMDKDGKRNEQRLKRIAGNNLWWVLDGTMYVYYTPTHYEDGTPEYSLNLNDYMTLKNW